MNVNRSPLPRWTTWTAVAVIFLGYGLLADPAQIAAAHWELNDDEYRAIDQAHAERDAMKLFAELDKAIQRVLAKWAREAAGSEYLAEKEEAAACMED